MCDKYLSLSPLFCIEIGTCLKLKYVNVMGKLTGEMEGEERKTNERTGTFRTFYESKVNVRTDSQH